MTDIEQVREKVEDLISLGEGNCNPRSVAECAKEILPLLTKLQKRLEAAENLYEAAKDATHIPGCMEWNDGEKCLDCEKKQERVEKALSAYRQLGDSEKDALCRPVK